MKPARSANWDQLRRQLQLIYFVKATSNAS